jgi:hypothetical protein
MSWVGVAEQEDEGHLPSSPAATKLLFEAMHSLEQRFDAPPFEATFSPQRAWQTVIFCHLVRCKSWEPRFVHLAMSDTDVEVNTVTVEIFEPLQKMSGASLDDRLSVMATLYKSTALKVYEVCWPEGYFDLGPRPSKDTVWVRCTLANVLKSF